MNDFLVLLGILGRKDLDIAERIHDRSRSFEKHFVDFVDIPDLGRAPYEQDLVDPTETLRTLTVEIKDLLDVLEDLGKISSMIWLIGSV